MTQHLVRVLALALMTSYTHSQTSFANEGAAGSAAWTETCVSESNLSREPGSKFCKCILRKVGGTSQNLKAIRSSNPAVVETCTTTGPKVWIKACVADSKMATTRGAKYCQCIWDAVGPENVPPLSVMKESEPEVLESCKPK